MAKDEKLGKWVEAMTPRHAIENFFDHATLVDSPDPEELYKSSLSSGLIKIPESTPLAKSPQSSQRSGWKRKSDHEEQYDGNGSKRNNVEEIDMSSSDSVSDTLVFPSNLESPHLVIPQKTELKIKKRMSVSAFTKAIHSQEPQESSVTMNESSIASTLGSPDEALSRRPRRLKNNTSVSDFAETLGKKVEKKIIKDDSSNMENTSVLSHLDSLEHISYEKRGTGVEKKRASSTGFKSILNKRSFQIGELSEDESTDHSTTPSAMLTEQYAHSKNSRLSPAFESMLSIPVEAHSQIEKTSSKIGSDAPSSNNSDSELYEGMPDLESPDDFSSPGSTIQVINRNSSGLPEVSKHLQNSIREKNETIPPDPFVSQNGKNLASASVSNSTYDVPSVLGSPQEYQEYYRPGHMPSKKKVSVTGFLATLSQTVDLQSRKSSNRSSTSKTSKRTSIGNVSEETGELLRQNTPSPLPEQLRRVTRSSSQAIDKTFVSPKTNPRKSPTLKLKHSESDESAHQLVNRSLTALVTEMDVIPQNSRQMSKRSSMADYRIIEHTEAEGSHSDKAVGIPLNVTPSKLTHEKREASRSSSRITNRSSVTSKPNPKSILHPELDGQVTKDSEDILPMQMKTSLSVTEIASPILAPIEARASSVLLSPKRQIRKSLNFSTPIIKDSSAATTPATEDGLPPIDEVEIEETPPTDVDSMEEDKVFEDDPAIEGIEKQAEAEDDHLSPKTATRSSHELNQFTRKSSSMQMTSANRYPALKNSTIVAGGSAFAGVTLSMSPIVPDKQGAPLRVPSSPKLTTPESPKTVAQFSETKEKSTPPKNLHRTPSHPSTPAPFGRKRTRSLTQSPMFMNVMKSTVQKAVSKTVKDQQQSVPIVASPGKNATTPKQVPSVKGLSLSNTKKGKSIALSAFDEMQDSSDTEWEDMEDNLKPKPACIKIAFEEIPDRSKDFVPFEERLMADPIFQAKMSLQQAKLASQKAAEEAAAAAKKATTKRKPRIIKKKEEDNIASVATNKGNFRFYARTKVTKDALEVVHGLVGEWFDFTLRQVEKYCIDEGKASLDTWEDCYKVLKRQGLVSDYVEYSGLCHDLLLNDECDQLLPTRPPPEYAEWRREAQKREK
ncbi:mucin-2-like isoform X3 [Daphnia carinata]|uniref:mucin-2-like isoform X3 n=1 Tax=Daphnia carinata TaxID=120202 RepID=UPI002868F49F|nr:mucin-2-like isoform X3 [Daphnia carinata]